MRILAEVSLVFITLIWGSTFVVVRHALDTVGPLTFVAARFTLATLVLAVLMRLMRQAPRPGWIRAGSFTGLFLALGFITQTVGLQTTAAGKAAFITGLSVVLVPFLSALVLRQPPPRAAWVGVALATLGLALLTLEPGLRFQTGDLWVLMCAFGFAAHITAAGRFTAVQTVLPFTLVQLLTVAGLAGMAALILEREALLPPPAAWTAILYMGVGATALVFILQMWGQKYASATHTALIFALEPVFAAIFAALVDGEKLVGRHLLGCVLILAGMLVAELGPHLVARRRALSRASAAR